MAEDEAREAEVLDIECRMVPWTELYRENKFHILVFDDWIELFKFFLI